MTARSPSRPTNAVLGTDRNSAGTGQPPTPAASSASLVHGTANTSIGSGNPFSSSSPTESKPMPSSRRGQHPHRGRYQDSIRRRLVTQARRLDRRHPEVVPVLDRRLTRPETDSHLQLLLGPPIAALDQLLHRHRAPHRRRCRAERHHQPVAGVPELAPARRADRLAQHREVLVPQLIRANRSNRRRQPRRTDEIGHQNRRQLDRLRHGRTRPRTSRPARLC